MSANEQAAAGGQPAAASAGHMVFVERSSGVQVGSNNVQNNYDYSAGSRNAQLPQPPDSGVPYRGLIPFTESGHEFFFGRNTPVAASAGEAQSPVTRMHLTLRCRNVRFEGVRTQREQDLLRTHAQALTMSQRRTAPRPAPGRVPTPAHGDGTTMGGEGLM